MIVHLNTGAQVYTHAYAAVLSNCRLFTPHSL